MKPYVVIKIGGVVATDEKILQSLVQEIHQLFDYRSFVLVHGGGKEVTALGEKLGYQAQFKDGIRITTPEEMRVVDMVLGGAVNIDLVRRSQTAGLKAVGLGGQDSGLFSAKALSFPEVPDSRTGKVESSNAELLELLCSEGYFPIIHSTTMDAQGRGLNINADEAAQAVAIALQAEALVYVSDIQGVLKDGKVLQQLNEEVMEKEIQAGVIAGGMIPKVKNAWQAVQSGVGKVIIGGYQASGDLEKLLNESSGTVISD